MILSGQISCICLHMLMRDMSLKQRIPCIIRISNFGAFSAEKSVHYKRVNTVAIFILILIINM